ncbi:hypothetical protein [Lactobacillus helveticus]|uniref:hypothetical protein n=1 Tax=Lactobacillus helveticus TaxID=1587 RepID=UPI00046CDE73|nr:hypothetical protein [Lactobacillus helveticus]NRO08781.1 hypothetical protein [Lactobacillus helveticus]NRO16166.1 hypothetical protein [Lactobacillus helveticus]NRO20369.1 hypothetical protein [Lactobacillus helveticus]NRO33049.1 hypothetical protein [Lactobacillus helveticus]NRO40769.1 hypothetical protein [Lactobacillus helveticus]
MVSITDNEISSSELSALVNGEPAANITIEVKYDKEGSTNPGTGDDQKGDNPGEGDDHKGDNPGKGKIPQAPMIKI